MEGLLRAAAPMLLMPMKAMAGCSILQQQIPAIPVQLTGVHWSGCPAQPQQHSLCPTLSQSCSSSQVPWKTSCRSYNTSRHFSSAADSLPETSSSQVATQQAADVQQGSSDSSSQQQHSQQAPAGTAWPAWDWQYVAGTKHGRKPAIKKPKRHQWLFCNPAYNPNQQLPPKILSPYAPTTVQQQDEWQVYRKLKPTHRQKDNKRYREQFMRWLALRDVDWRNAFSMGVAQDMKQLKNQERLHLRQKRQEAWEAYKASLLLPDTGSEQQGQSSNSASSR